MRLGGSASNSTFHSYIPIWTRVRAFSMAIVNEKNRENLASRHKKSSTARLVKSKNCKKICNCATLRWHYSTIVNQNINILFLFHFLLSLFLLSLIFCLSTPLSHRSLSSHLFFFSFSSFFNSNSLIQSLPLSVGMTNEWLRWRGREK